MRYHRFMTSVAPLPPRERILRAALDLLERGGVEAVSTRAVSAAADVQPPTIYRQFGDMPGLLDAVATLGFATYLRDKTSRPPSDDPVADLRRGWDRHIEFGLAHPHLYTLMYGTLRPGREPPAAREARALLHGLLRRVAESGRLAMDVERAADMIHAGGMGMALSLLESPTPDRGAADRMRDAVLAAILTPDGAAPDGDERRQAASHAVALAALLPRLDSPLSGAEQALLLEWLRRLT